jgi:cellulase/cellobiase CelA1
VTFTTGPPVVDTTPPSTPGTPVASAITSTSATLTWTASTDNVGVTGYDIFRGGTQVGTSATNSFSATGLSPATSYSYTVRARDAAGNLSVVSSAGAFTTLPSGGGSCDVAYVIDSQWQGAFSGKVTIKNTGTSTIDGWTLRFAFPATGQGVNQGWSATWSQSGPNVSAVNLDWNRVLAPGNSTQIGFNGVWTSANPEPAAFTLNNSACTIS